MATHNYPNEAAGRRVNTLAAYVFGVVFVLVGLLGFAVSGGHPAVGHDGGLLLGAFEVNVLHNIAHLVLGAVLIAAAVAGVRAAKLANIVVGAIYLVLFVIGLFIAGDHAGNIIALNGADNVLHLVLAAALLGIGLGADRKVRPEA